MTVDDIRAALRDCYDPGLRCNVVDLGLIRSIAVELDPSAPGADIPGVPPRHRVAVAFAPATADEAAAAHLGALIYNRLAGLAALSRIAVTAQTEPAWSPADITPAGRRSLGLDGNPALVQIQAAGS